MSVVNFCIFIWNEDECSLLQVEFWALMNVKSWYVIDAKTTKKWHCTLKHLKTFHHKILNTKKALRVHVTYKRTHKTVIINRKEQGTLTFEFLWYFSHFLLTLPLPPSHIPAFPWIKDTYQWTQSTLLALFVKHALLALARPTSSTDYNQPIEDVSKINRSHSIVIALSATDHTFWSGVVLLGRACCSIDVQQLFSSYPKLIYKKMPTLLY